MNTLQFLTPNVELWNHCLHTYSMKAANSLVLALWSSWWKTGSICSDGRKGRAITCRRNFLCSLREKSNQNFQWIYWNPDRPMFTRYRNVWVDGAMGRWRWHDGTIAMVTVQCYDALSRHLIASSYHRHFLHICCLKKMTKDYLVALSWYDSSFTIKHHKWIVLLIIHKDFIANHKINATRRKSWKYNHYNVWNTPPPL